MRILVVGFALAILGATPSWAADCSKGSAAAITVSSWEAEEAKTMFGGTSTSVALTLKNTLAKGIRLVDASVLYSDALGNNIGTYKVAPDLTIDAGQEAHSSGNYTGAAQLLSAHHDDIVVQVCTVAVVYEDGAKEEF